MPTAFVTGASAGIGAATARLLVEQGWLVAGSGRREGRLHALREELGDRFMPVIFDVADRGARTEALGSLTGPFAAVDLLVNNAGLALGVEPAQEVAWADWATMIETNVTALAAVTHALLPSLIDRRGMVVNLGSVAGTYPYTGGNVYGASKAFVHQFSLGLRADLNGTGVRVSVIEPGMVETEFTAVRRRQTIDAAADLYRGMAPLTAEDIARTILWVATQPPHVNVNVVEIMPTDQSFAGFQVHREG